MREQADRAYFRVEGDDGDPSVMHARRETGERLGLAEISREEAEALSARRRVRAPSPSPLAMPDMPAATGNVASDEAMKSVFDLCARIIEKHNEAKRELAVQIAEIGRLSHLNHLWLLAIEAQSDPSPSVAAHAIIASAIGLTAASDGDAQAWGEAIKRFKESGR